MAEPTRHVHFVGIGGIGMSGIAELLVNLGYQVSGSDARTTDITRRLAGMGVRVHEGHAGDNIGDADVVVVTSAARQDNPEIVEARRRGVPVIARAEMLAELMRLRRTGIAIGGAHGKTTTTSMVALMLERAGLDPTAVIGGRLSAFGSNARLGQGDVIVAEADESDGSFLEAVAGDQRHHQRRSRAPRSLRHVRGRARRVRRVCQQGALRRRRDRRRGRPGAVGTHPAHDAPRRDLRHRQRRRPCSSRAPSRTGHGTSTCEVWRRATHGDGTTERLGTLVLHVPGRHNLRNALAAVGVGLELGLPFDRIASGLAEFRGAERRLQVVGERAGVLVVDDYGHHPTEIAAVIAACREAWSRRLVLLFQPHRYTRTAGLLDEFAEVLAQADEVCLLPIYAASEDPIPGVTSEALGRGRELVAAAAPCTSSSGLAEAPASIAAFARAGDLVVTLGAGSVGSLGPRLLDALEARG